MSETTSNIRSVLFITYHFPPEIGGIQTRIKNYVICLNQMGIKVSVIVLASRQRSNDEEFTLAEARIFWSSGRISHLPSNLFLVFRCILSGKADVLHLFTGGSTLTGSLSLLLARTARKRAIMSIFGREDLTFSSRLSKAMFDFSAFVSKSITSNSDATKALLSNKYQRKTRILLGGAELPSVSPSDDTHTTSQPVVLFVGRLVRRKGVDDLLQSFVSIRSKMPTARLVIVGDGPEKERLVHIANDLRLNSSVEFRGALMGEELQRAYEECTVFVLPSKLTEDDPATEGLGLALIEASMHGKPLVGTIHGGIPEIIENGENGYLVPEASPVELSKAIANLLTNPALSKRLGDRALEIAKQKYSWESATRKLLEAYKG